MTRILVVSNPSHPVRTDRFRETAPEFAVDELELPDGGVDVDGTDELRAALDAHDAMFIRCGRITSQVIESDPALRVIAVHGAGYDHVDVTAATRNGVVVTNNPDGPGPAVVEHTFALVFTLLRDLPARFDRTATGDWTGARDTVIELRGRTVGVVGLGTIGFPVARTASIAFGANVLGYDPYVTGERDAPIWPRVDRETVVDAGVELVGKDDLFERSEVVSVHVPLTDETRGLVGEAELDALGDGYLINTARGDIVDEAALLSALDRDVLAGVGLDVLSEEPPDPAHPLLGREDVYVTPHIAGVTDGYLERAAELSARKIRTVIDGGRPRTVVNPAVFAGSDPS